MPFTATNVIVSHANQIVLTGLRTPVTRLWQFTMPTQAEPTSPKPIVETTLATIGSAMPAKLIRFAHATLFSPALSTLEEALKKGYLTNFPGFTAKLLQKHPPQSFAMVKGHLDQTRKNQSTTKVQFAPSPAKTDCMLPTLEPSQIDSNDINKQCHFCYAAIMQPTGQIYTDQTGKFVQPSSNGTITYLFFMIMTVTAFWLSPSSPVQPMPSLVHTKCYTHNSAMLGYTPNCNAWTMNAPNH